MTRVALRQISSQLGRNLLTLTGIALGVTLIVAVSVVNRSISHAFTETVDALTGKAVLEVQGGDLGFDEEVLEVVRSQAGVAHAAALVLGNVFFDDDSGQSLAIVGVDVVEERGVRTYEVEAAEGMGVEDPLVFLNSPDSLLVTEGFANRRGLRVGDALTVLTPVGKRTLTVRGALRPQGLARVLGEGLGVMDILAAQVLFAKEGKFDRISITAQDGAAVDTIAESISRRLPPGVVVRRPEQRRMQMDSQLAGFQYTLSAMSGLALLVGLCMVYNTMSTAVVRRQRELGVLRALGGRRRDILRLILAEATVVGFVGSLVGWAGGAWLAQFLTAVFAKSAETSFDLSLGTPSTLSPGLSEFLKAMAGVGAAVIGAWGPGRWASRLPVTEVLRPGLAERAAESNQSRTALAGLALLILSLGLITLGAAFRWPIVLGVSTGLLFVAFIVLAASGAALLGARSQPLLGYTFGVMGAAVATSVARAPRRTAFTAAVVAVGMAVHILTATVHNSVKGNLIDDVRGELRADLVVSSSFLTRGRLTSPVPGSFAAPLRNLAGVDDVAVMRRIYQRFRKAEVLVQAHTDTYFTNPRYGYEKSFTAGDRDSAMHAVLFDGAALVSHNFAFLYDVKPGDVLTLDTPAGEAPIPVAGVVVEHMSSTGAILLSYETYQRWWKDPLASEFYVLLTPGVDARRVKEEIVQLSRGEQRFRVLQFQELLDFYLERIDRVFRFTGVLDGVVLLVALLSLVDTLLMSVLGRGREIGVLRALGARRVEVFRMVVLEGLVVSGLGAVMGLIGGSAIAVLWMRVHFKYLFGWIMDVYFPMAGAATALTFVLLIVLVSAYPAWRASRLSVVRSLAYE